jgi:subtilisin family serine protease
VTTVARPLRGLLPAIAACAVLAGTVLPATVLPGPVARAAVAAPAAAQPAAGAGEWWLAALHAPAGQAGAGPAARGVTVAVLSTGVDASHPDLTGVVTAGPDLGRTGRTAGGSYWGEEGTAVASLISGHGHGPGGAAGVTGIAPGTRILSVPVTLEYDDPLNSDATVGGRLPAAIAAGIRYAVGHGASVIALPLDPGTLGPSSAAGDAAAAGGSAAERAAVSYAVARNVLLVAPAGDNGKAGSVNYPAAYPGVIAVGATGRDGRLAPFSNAGSYVALTAPGSDTTPAPGSSSGTTAPTGLTVAAPGDGYQSLASSDMSAALTAGAAALIRARYPRLTAAQVTRDLEHGATAPPRPAGQPAPAGWGHGALNASAALAAAATTAAALPPPAPTASAAASSPAVATSSVPASPVSAPARPVAARHDPGHLLRSLVVGLAIAAGVLIAGLIGAIAAIRVRRRGRAATLADLAAVARPRRGASRARHARGQRDDPAGQRDTGLRDTGPWRPDAPARTRDSSPRPADSPPPGDSWRPGGSPRPEDSPAWPRESAAEPRVTGLVLWPPGQTAPQEQPPWAPADPPGRPVNADSFLPAPAVLRRAPAAGTFTPDAFTAPPDREPAPAPETAVPPWERSPADFAIALPEEDAPSWPGSNTGPMYVWNPAATTGPLSIAADQVIAGGQGDDDGRDDSDDES